MSLLINERNEIATSSPVHELGSEPETKRLRIDDWWYLDSTSNPTDETTVGELIVTELDSTRSASTRKKLRPVRKVDRILTLDGDRKVILQQWECVVLERHDDAVCCELHDLTDESNPPEYAEVLLCEFNAWDLPLLAEGAKFSIGASDI